MYYSHGSYTVRFLLLLFYFSRTGHSFVERVSTFSVRRDHLIFHSTVDNARIVRKWHSTAERVSSILFTGVSGQTDGDEVLFVTLSFPLQYYQHAEKERKARFVNRGHFLKQNPRRFGRKMINGTCVMYSENTWPQNGVWPLSTSQRLEFQVTTKKVAVITDSADTRQTNEDTFFECNTDVRFRSSRS